MSDCNFFLKQLKSNSKKVSSEQGEQSFKLFLLFVFNKETTKEEPREGYASQNSCTHLLAPLTDPTSREDLKCRDRTWNQPPVPAGSESQPQPPNLSPDGKTRLEGARDNKLRSSVETTGRGGAPDSPLPQFSGRPPGLAWFLAKGRQTEATLLRKKSVPDSAQCLFGGTNASPFCPPADGQGAGTLKAGHWAFRAPRPARPAPAGGSSGAAAGAASGQSSSHTRSSCRAVRPCGCAGAAPSQTDG